MIWCLWTVETYTHVLLLPVSLVVFALAFDAVFVAERCSFPIFCFRCHICFLRAVWIAVVALVSFVLIVTGFGRVVSPSRFVPVTWIQSIHSPTRSEDTVDQIVSAQASLAVLLFCCGTVGNSGPLREYRPRTHWKTPARMSIDVLVRGSRSSLSSILYQGNQKTKLRMVWYIRRGGSSSSKTASQGGHHNYLLFPMQSTSNRLVTTKLETPEPTGAPKKKKKKEKKDSFLSIMT